MAAANTNFIFARPARLGFLLKTVGALLAGLSAAQGVLADVAPPAGSSRVYVQMAPGQKAVVMQTIAGNGGVVHHEFDTIGAVAVTLPDAAVEGLRRSPAVRLVEPDPVRYLLAEQIPPGISAVQAPVVWVINEGGQDYVEGDGVVVGVIDSGIYPSHEDFAGVAIDGYPKTQTVTVYGKGKPRTTTVNLTEADEQYWARDRNGHGTHVSGTIAAAANNLGVVGMSPGKAGIFMVKVFGDTGNWVYSSSLLNAAQVAVNTGGADVISMSLGGPTASSTEESGLAALEAQGVVLVAAAGNDGNTAFSYPASYTCVISVAAVSVSGTGTQASDFAVADFSQQNDQVEIAAPGVSVLSTVPFVSTSTVTAGVTTIGGHPVEFAGTTSASGVAGALVDGGLATSTSSGWAGKVVLVERGSISFYDKVLNVQNSGGVAAVIYNNVAGEELYGTLGAGNSSSIPAIGITLEDGNSLRANRLGQSATVVNHVAVPASGYEAWNGTSMAAPHVSGGVALLLDAYPDATPAQIRQALSESAMDLGAVGRDNATGHGLLQVGAALARLGEITAGGGGGGGGDAPVISNLTSRVTNAKQGRFEISWTTSIPADGRVDIGGSTYTSSTLTTSHVFSFRGTKGAVYPYTVYSTANGQTASAGGTHQN